MLVTHFPCKQHKLLCLFTPKKVARLPINTKDIPWIFSGSEAKNSLENMICKRYSYGSYNLYHHQLSYQQKWIHEFDVVCGRKGPIMQPISPLSCPATQPLCATHFTPLHHLRHHHPHHKAKGLGLGWGHGARIEFGRVHFGAFSTTRFALPALSSNWILLPITRLPNFVFFLQIFCSHHAEILLNGALFFFECFTLQQPWNYLINHDKQPRSMKNVNECFIILWACWWQQGKDKIRDFELLI